MSKLKGQNLGNHKSAVDSLFSSVDIKKADEKIGIIRMISGKTAAGEECYIYISVKPSLYEEFDRKVDNSEKMNVESYGKVLHAGFGKEPTEDVKKFLEEKYGIDHNFAENARAAIEQEAFKMQAEKK